MFPRSLLPILAAALPLLLSGGLATAAEAAPRLTFPRTGFSIEPLEAESPLSSRQVLFMFLPPTNGFASSVNVQVQAYDGPFETYVSISEGQFKTGGMKVLRIVKDPSGDGATFEYTGKMQGRDLHWYSRAQKRGASIHLVTATADQARWEADGPALKKCVDSYRPDPAPGK